MFARGPLANGFGTIQMKKQKTWQKLKNNPSLFPRYFVREQMLDGIREFFKREKFHEVEVPLLSPSLIPESYLEVFETTLLDRKHRKYRGFLAPSPEVFLKKLLASGIGNCFTITKSFRNMDVFSPIHNPEFTMMEWYRVSSDYTALMTDLEELFVSLFKKLFPKKKESLLEYQGKTINLTPPWHRISMIEGFKKYADIDLTAILEDKPIRQLAEKRGYTVTRQNTWEELFNQLFLNEVEPRLPADKPVFLCEYPVQLASLSRKNPSDPRFAQRFELYIAGLELANCFSELADPDEQTKRFEANQKERKRLGKIVYPADIDFLKALKTGLPTCAGGALGVDRLIMLFANAKTINGTLFFPASEMWGKK